MNKSLAKTITLLEKTKGLSNQIAKANQTISNWNISQHIDHIILVNNKISEVICSGTLDESSILPTKFLVYVVLATKFIPRGKGKSPEQFISSMPVDKKIINKLDEHLLELKKQSDLIDSSIKKPGKFNHPVFGGLTRGQWLKFMHIHSLHHFKIITDISNK